jgi:uracil-DNA glycosylase family 4
MNSERKTPAEIARIARDLAMRIRWEVESGGAGYALDAEPVRASVAKKDRGDQGGPAAQAEPAAQVDPGRALIALREEIGDCTRCGLHEKRQNIVFGEGNPNASLVFVGEGPGRDEDVSGRPFVGAAGQLLDRIIGAITLRREEVYICNVVKCRPPDNRTPGQTECATCGPFLHKQLNIIGPRVVVALGGTATGFLLERGESLGKLRGRFHQAAGFTVMPTYHPAYLLRSPQGKRPVWEDMKQVAAELGLALKGA